MPCRPRVIVVLVSVQQVQHVCIVSMVRQFWKLGAVVRVPGARTRRVRAIKPWCGVVAISQP